jgi:peroxiredoxin
MLGSVNFIKPNLNNFQEFRSKALCAGLIAPNFSVPQQNGLWQNLPADLLLHQPISLAYLSQDNPILLSFYSPLWDDYGDIQIVLIQKSYKKLIDLGIDILVVTTVHPDQLPDLARKFKLTLNICFDEGNHIAQQFGVIRDDYPTWQHFSGISGNIPLPASYLILPNGRIIHDFFDENLNTFLSFKEIEAFVNNYRLHKK